MGKKKKKITRVACLLKLHYLKIITHVFLWKSGAVFSKQLMYEIQIIYSK